MTAQIDKINREKGKKGLKAGKRRPGDAATPGDEGGSTGFFKNFMPFLYAADDGTTPGQKRGR